MLKFYCRLNKVYSINMTLFKYVLIVVSFSMCLLIISFGLIHYRIDQIREETAMDNAYIPEDIKNYLDYDDYVFYEDDSYEEEDEDLLNTEDEMRMLNRMEERRQWAEDACERLGEDLNGTPNGWEYLINYEHQLIWCNIFKAASSSWLTNFLTLAGHNMKEFKKYTTPVQAARTIYPRPSGEELLQAHNTGDSIAFVIVRHPFERLSSAYRDKCRNIRSNGFYTKICKSIVQNYRVGVPDTKDPNILGGLHPTFEEFIRFILDEHTKNSTLDIHWQPYSTFCTPCQMHFDIIMKMETFDEDQNYLIQRAGLEDKLTPAVVNVGSEKKIEFGKNTSELLQDHYSQLTKDQITQLYTMYRYDFEIFNYTMDNYYDYVSSDKTE